MKLTAYVVRMIGRKKLFWNSHFGTWGPLEEAVLYTKNERQNLTLPEDGEWIKLVEQ